MADPAGSAKAAPIDVAPLAAALRAGDRRALARAITLAESTRAEHRRAAEALLAALLPAPGGTLRLGVTGAPGVGKSTFIEALGQTIIAAGHRVAVLAVDPSSKRGGGSILGDKTRMTELGRRPEAFIRPTPAGHALGGVARHTRDAMMLCEAADFDVIIVETVGVGQSETDVADMVDMFLLLVAPGGGDDLQGIKRGIVELADLILVNKADGDLEPAARRTVADYRHALRMLRPPSAYWQAEVEAISSLEAQGFDLTWRTIERFRAAATESGGLLERRARQADAALWREIGEELIEDFRADPEVGRHLPGLEARLVAGAITPAAAARFLLGIFRGGKPAP